MLQGNGNIINALFAVVIGLDSGETGHQACELDTDANSLYGTPLPQGEVALREPFTSPHNYGHMLAVVDQPNTIGALQIAIDRDGEVLSALERRVGFDEELAHESNRSRNWFRTMLTQIDPGLKRAVAGGLPSAGLAGSSQMRV